MSTPAERPPPSWHRDVAIARRFLVLSIYRFFGLLIVGSMPLITHTLISLQFETAVERTWVAPELWLLSLVTWGTPLAESLAEERGGLRCYLVRLASLIGVISSAYAYGSLMAHAPAAAALNEVFQRWPIRATIVAAFVFGALNYPALTTKAADDVEKGRK